MLMNLIEVGDEGDVEPEMEREVIRRDEKWQNDDGNLNSNENNEEERIIEKEHEERGRETENEILGRLKYDLTKT